MTITTEPTTITLTPAEYVHAAQAGFLRQAANVCRGRRDAHGYSGDGYDIHVLGAVGEYVVARALGLFWAGPGRLAAPDVGTLQVRTRSQADYDLIVHPRDADDAVFVLVTGQELRYVVRGWMYGRDAKQRHFWRDPAGNRPAFFVPQACLRRIEELRCH